jgi:acyl dehydratase
VSPKNLDCDFVYPDSEICIQPALQHAKLKCCGIAPEVFGEYVDITHYAMETMMAAKRGGASINGSVHVSQFFDQRSPIRLGETVKLIGKVTQVEDAPKGRLVTSRFEVVRPGGDTALVLERISLRVDPEKAAVKPQTRDISQSLRPEELTLLSQHPLAPEKVAEYSAEGENLIHSDPEVARQFGFRAPIAAGLMAVRLMMAHLWSAGTVESLRMTVNFRRPMFWDDALALYGAGKANEHLLIMRTGDGKIANESHVDAVAYRPV